jgi:hypothetical protein
MTWSQKAKVALAASALGFGLAPSCLAAWQEPRESPANPSSTQARDNGQASQTTFSGRIIQGKNGKFVLEDAAKSSRLVLDKQSLAKKFAGQKVVVTGTFDESKSLLRVKKIEPAS